MFFSDHCMCKFQIPLTIHIPQLPANTRHTYIYIHTTQNGSCQLMFDDFQQNNCNRCLFVIEMFFFDVCVSRNHWRGEWLGIRVDNEWEERRWEETNPIASDYSETIETTPYYKRNLQASSPLLSLWFFWRFQIKAPGLSWIIILSPTLHL